MKRLRIPFVAIVLLLLGCIVFRDFVFGNKLLLYKDIGDDSVNFHYPYFTYLSDYLRSNGWPRWSFCVGMGQSIFQYSNSLLFDPVVWLSRSLIASALVYQHLVKLVLCGLFLFGFLRMRGTHFIASLLGAMLVSLSAYMCMGSCWTVLGNEVLCLILVLFGVELALTRGSWLCLTLAVACCGLLTPLHLYFAAVLLTFYVIARLFSTNKRFGPGTAFCLKLALFAFVGVGLAAFLWLNTLSTVLSSPRGAGIASYTSKLTRFPVFGLEKPVHYISAVYRQFSNDMLGTGSNFLGWQNYLESPSSYCGLICLLLLPQIFVRTTARRRLVAALCVLAIVCMTIFPWFRYLFWLFQGDYYRTLSLFCVFGLVTLSMTVLARYLEERTLNYWVLGATLLILITILSMWFGAEVNLVDRKLKLIAICLLCAYAIILAIGNWLNQESIAAWAIVVLSAAELCYFDHVTVVDDRPTVTKTELGERIGYNDETVDAIRDIKARDKGFYRITKLYSSSPAIYKSLNDAVVFGYYGTTSYNSFNNINYIRFLLALNVLPPAATEYDTRWSRGLVGRRDLLTFACEKYVLTPDPFPYRIDPAFEFVGEYGKVSVFKNKDSIPFGVFFTKYVQREVFMRSSPEEKKDMLEDAVVLGQEQSPVASDMEGLSGWSYGGQKDSRHLQLRRFNENRIAGEIQCDRAGVLLFQMPFDRGWRADVDHRRTETFKVDEGLLGIKLTKGRHMIKLHYLPPLLGPGIAISALSLLIVAVCLWRMPRISAALG